jgi:hypothetical protein
MVQHEGLQAGKGTVAITSEMLMGGVQAASTAMRNPKKQTAGENPSRGFLCLLR